MTNKETTKTTLVAGMAATAVAQAGSAAVEEAFERMEDNCEFADNRDIGCGSSSGYEIIKKHAIELMEYLLPKYKKQVTDDKEKRRMKLLDELKTLEEE